MRRAVPIGFFLAGLALTLWSFVSVIEVGTCASGGPYVIAQPCPEGTGLLFLGMAGGILAVVVGMLWVGTSSVSLGLASFGLLFVALGIGFLAADVVPIGQGMEGAGYVCGVLFVLMGLPPFLGGLRAASKGRHKPRRNQDSVELLLGRDYPEGRLTLAWLMGREERSREDERRPRTSRRRS